MRLHENFVSLATMGWTEAKEPDLLARINDYLGNEASAEVLSDADPKDIFSANFEVPALNRGGPDETSDDWLARELREAEEAQVASKSIVVGNMDILLERAWIEQQRQEIKTVDEDIVASKSLQHYVKENN